MIVLRGFEECNPTNQCNYVIYHKTRSDYYLISKMELQEYLIIWGSCVSLSRTTLHIYTCLYNGPRSSLGWKRLVDTRLI